MIAQKRKRVDSVPGLRLKPTDPVILAMPLGEWVEATALLCILGVKPDVREILPSDRWNAQGLEGAGEVRMPLGMAQVLARRAGRNRATLYVADQEGA